MSTAAVEAGEEDWFLFLHEGGGGSIKLSAGVLGREDVGVPLSSKVSLDVAVPGRWSEAASSSFSHN